MIAGAPARFASEGYHNHDPTSPGRFHDRDPGVAPAVLLEAAARRLNKPAAQHSDRLPELSTTLRRA